MFVVLPEFLAPYGTLLAASVFVGFFVVALLAFVFRNRRGVRPLFGLFLVTLLLGSSLTAIQPTPIFNANEYTTTAPEQYDHYDLRVVDEDGNELAYDPAAMRPNLQNEELAENIGKPVTGSEKTQLAYTDAERAESAAFLLREAQEYRQRVESGPDPLALLAFPPHHLRGHWSATELRTYSNFVGIRVYRMHVTFTDDGRETVVNSETLVYEYSTSNTTS